MTGRNQVNIERIRYWQGQKLRARDFRAQTTSDAELRWWHNRALHNAFGIRSGLSASPMIANGTLTAVRVECGIAYDCYGRELILQLARHVEVPVLELQKPAAVTLVAHYKRVSERGNRHYSIKATAFSWKPALEVGTDEGVPVAKLRYLPSAKLDAFPVGLEFPSPLKFVRYDSATKRLVSKSMLTAAEKKALFKLSDDKRYRAAVTDLVEDPEFVFVFDSEFRAPVSRALSRPRIGRGETVPGDTPWDTWIENVIGPDREVHEIPLGVQVTIDTSAAGFTRTPVYFAWLQGALWNRTNVEFFPFIFSHLDNESITGFRLRLWMPRIICWTGSRARFTNNSFDAAFLNFARQQGLYVCWLGVGCQEDELPVCVEAPDCCCTEEA